MIDGVRLHEAGPDDWEAWRDLRLRSLRESPDAFASTYEREVAFAEQDWRERLSHPPAILALTGQGDPVALGAGFKLPDRDEFMVVAMWTEAQWRGHGIGTGILDRIVGHARAAGLPVHLWVTDGNSAARRAYVRYGFVGTGEVDVLRPGSPLRIERLDLP